MGITVIQAKHTNAINAHFGDASFSSEAPSSVISKELGRIRKLVEAKELDNYLLVSNRRLGGNASSEIANRIADSTGIERSKVKLAGVEFLNEFLHEYQDVLSLARIEPIDGPLQVSSWELAEVILAIADELESVASKADAPIVPRVSYAQKNELNKMSPEFAARLSQSYMVYTETIDRFLADPANGQSLEYYEGVVEEFNLKLVAKYQDSNSFDDIFNYLVDVLRKRDGILASRVRLVRVMLFYMYFHCDIGKVS